MHNQHKGSAQSETIATSANRLCPPLQLTSVEEKGVPNVGRLDAGLLLRASDDEARQQEDERVAHPLDEAPEWETWKGGGV